MVPKIKIVDLGISGLEKMFWEEKEAVSQKSLRPLQEADDPQRAWVAYILGGLVEGI